MNKYKRYEKYKNSGEEWLGEIPEEWESKKFKYVFSFGKGLNITKENLTDSGVPCVNYGEVHSKYGFSLNPDKQLLKCVNNDYLNTNPKALITNGDFVFADTSEDIEGSGNFTHLISSYQIFAGYHTVIARPKRDINNKYLAYVCESKSFRNQVRNNVKGVKVYSITKGILGNTCVWYPNNPMQETIAIFLDNETAKIDSAIEKKEKLIDLLKEQKQIIIQNAVTGKLSMVNGQWLPTSPEKMKDSGVEWIGDIPEGWKVKKCKYLFYEVAERSVEGKEELLSVSHMTGVTPRSEKDVNMFLAEDYSGSKVCKDGDLIYNIMWAWMGALGVAHQSGIVSPAYGIYRQFYENTFNKEFLEYKLKTVKYIEYYNKVSTGLHSSRLRFYAHMFMNMKIDFPRKEEQDQIAEYIETQSAKIDKAITLQEKQIAKLKEYKTILVDSAVTGKIKVV